MPATQATRSDQAGWAPVLAEMLRVLENASM